MTNSIAFVCPWYGADLTGGAESHTREVAMRLAARGHDVHVLTTCSPSFQGNWSENFHKPGTSQLDGVTVHRFAVDRRNDIAFDVTNQYLLSQTLGSTPETTALEKAHSDLFCLENINSTPLQEYIADNVDRFRCFVFIPYLYGTSIFGARSCPGKAVLNPCLHDEVYAYLPEVAEMFGRAAHVLCLSEGEKQLAINLYGPAIAAKTTVVGAGVEIESGDSARPNIDGLPGNFLLCLGRRDPGKGLELLLDAWRAFRSRHVGSSLGLILAGPGSSDYGAPDHAVWDLGFVDGATKRWLLEHCRALVQPSPNESYSRVLMEAWMAGKPAIVNSGCLATARAMAVASGGWAAGSEEDWCGALEEVDEAGQEDLRRLGQQGAAYAEKYANWDRVIDAYEDILITQPLNPLERIESPKATGALHQLLPTLRLGDAISNQALWFQKVFRAKGLKSEIYVKTCSPEFTHLVKAINRSRPAAGEALLFHHSIGNEITAIAAEHRGPKALLYHNITPHHFFEAYDPDFAALLKEGREALPDLAPHFSKTYADSIYNAAELSAAGFATPTVLPIVVDPSRWAQKPDNSLGSLLNDGIKNILFVGRLAPNKGHLDLIDAFYRYLCLDAGARLILAGYVDYRAAYTKLLLKKIEDYGIKSRVLILRNVDESTLYTLYRSANLFWSFSDHEGFCVPVIEAMWFDVPVLAFASTAVPETMADAGLLFDDKSDPKACAALAYHLINDAALRSVIIDAQRRRRAVFTIDSVLPRILSLVDDFIS